MQGVDQEGQGAAQLLQMMKAVIERQQDQGQQDGNHQAGGL